MVCADTSFLVRLFVREPGWEIAARWLDGLGTPVSVSRLNLLEFENALGQKVFRGSLTRSQATRVSLAFEKLRASGRVRFLQDPEGMWEVARDLTRSHAGETGVRSLDVLSVTHALQSGAVHFGSFDLKQRRLVEAIGISLNPTK